MSTQIIQTKQMNNNNVNNFYKYFNNMDVRVYKDENQNPWFVARDVAEILDYTNTTKAIRDHIDAEDKCVIGQIESQNDGERIVPQKNNTILINESGLYSLILRSKKKEAKQFKRWITSEVIPSLRKNGEYVVPKNVIKEKLECIEIASRIFSTLRNGEIQDRDKLLLEDLARNAMIGSVSNMNEISKENEEWSLSRRLQEVYGVSGKNIKSMSISFGKKVAVKYREKNNKEPPKRTQYVDGTTRSINCYFSFEFDEYIDAMIEEHFKDFLQYEEKDLKTTGTKSELISYLIQK